MPTDTLHWLNTLEGLLPLVLVVLVVVAIAIMATLLILDLLDAYRLFEQKAVFIELTPAAQTDKTPDANQRLFSILHGMEGSRPVLDKLLRHKVIFSLETASTREQGIRYVWRVSEEAAEVFEQTIASYMPEAKFKRVSDFLPEHLDREKLRVLSFKQAGHFAYPLQTQFSLELHDPAAYINGAMTQPWWVAFRPLTTRPALASSSLLPQPRH